MTLWHKRTCPPRWAWAKWCNHTGWVFILSKDLLQFLTRCVEYNWHNYRNAPNPASALKSWQHNLSCLYQSLIRARHRRDAWIQVHRTMQTVFYLATICLHCISLFVKWLICGWVVYDCDYDWRQMHGVQRSRALSWSGNALTRESFSQVCCSLLYDEWDRWDTRGAEREYCWTFL